MTNLLLVVKTFFLRLAAYLKSLPTRPSRRVLEQQVLDYEYEARSQRQRADLLQQSVTALTSRVRDLENPKLKFIPPDPKTLEFQQPKRADRQTVPTKDGPQMVPMQVFTDEVEEVHANKAVESLANLHEVRRAAMDGKPLTPRDALLTATVLHAQLPDQLKKRMAFPNKERIFKKGVDPQYVVDAAEHGEKYAKERLNARQVWEEQYAKARGKAKVGGKKTSRRNAK